VADEEKFSHLANNCPRSLKALNSSALPEGS
jgi:hypothetical protein